MSDTIERDFLTPDQLVKRWQGTVTKATLSNWRSAKRGPVFVKVGGRVLYRVSDIERYETKNRSQVAV